MQCIRSVLPNKPECPICRMTAKESHIVRNSMVGETVKAWSDVRHVLRFFLCCPYYNVSRLAFIFRALVLKLSNESPQPPIAHFFNSNSKRKLSYNSPDSSKEAGPSRLPYDNRSIISSHKEGTYDRTERPRKTRRLSVEEDIIPSSDPEEQELPNPATSGFSPSNIKISLNSQVMHRESSCSLSPMFAPSAVQFH